MANLFVNRLNTTISAADEAALTAALTTIKTTLNPYLKQLTAEERQSLFSLREENLVFAHEAYHQADTLGDLIPTAMAGVVSNLDNDLEFHKQLSLLETTELQQLVERVGDTRRLAAHEAYVGALSVYKLIEALAAMGVPGAIGAYDILKVRFANQGGAPAQPEP